MFGQFCPLEYRVSRHTLGDAPGAPIHLIVYARGSAKAKRRTICGLSKTILKTLAPFDLDDARDPLWERGCVVCLDGMVL